MERIKKSMLVWRSDLVGMMILSELSPAWLKNVVSWRRKLIILKTLV